MIGGVHGVEPQSAYVAKKLAEFLNLEQFIQPQDLFAIYKGSVIGQISEDLPYSVKKNFIVIPDLNRDGLKNNTRGNARGVDINRNFPSVNWSSNFVDKAYFPGEYPASEKETQELVKIIKKVTWDLFISIHTNHFVKYRNPPQVNFDGPQNTWGHAQGKYLAQLMELPFTHDIGYSTNGSLGSYARDIGVPCITIELDDKYGDEGAWAKYGLSLMKFLN